MDTMTSTVPVGGDKTKKSFVERKKQEVKDVARAKASELGGKAKADAKSMWFRNRRQLAPIKASAAVAATGTTGALVAEYADVADLAVAGGTGAFALAGGYLALNKLADRIPDGFLGRVKTGLMAGCAWCATLPLTGADAEAMWLALGLGTVSLSAKWWQRIRPGYPSGPAVAPKADSEATAPQRNLEDEDHTPVSTALIIERWAQTIQRSGGVLPDAEINLPRALEHGRAFPVQLAPGVQTVATARGALDRIASGLRIPAAKLAIEEADPDDPSVVELRVVDRSPVLQGVAYQGPRIVTDDEGVHIALGPYADGDGDAKYTVFTENSMRSGFIFGGTGAGKSRVVELIAIGLRKLGVEIWYLDPQEGQSSPALIELADWSLSGLGDDENPTGNIDKLYRAMKRGMSYRSKRLGADRQEGFEHTRKMPGIMVIIEEASDVFSEVDKAGVTYGTRFGEISKKIRKNGIGMLAVGHVYTLPTFGGDKMLRSSLTMYNLIALKTTEKSDSSLLPNGMPDPTVLPMLPGFGYIKSVASPRIAQFRAERMDEDDPERWLAELSGYDLDAGTANSIGDMYVRRHEIAEEKRLRRLRELEAVENGDVVFDDEDDEPVPERRPAAASASVLSLPLMGAPTATPSAQAPSGAAQRLMELVTSSGGKISVADAAERMGVSQQAVRNHARTLTDLGLVTRDKGVIHAK